MRQWIVVVLSCMIVLMSFGRTAEAATATSSYAVIDADTGRLLIGMNEHERLPIASLTKMWTAFVAIEESSLNTKTTISKKATLSEGSSIYLVEGETTTLKTLLNGLLLRSGNDAATAIAEEVGGSVGGFVKLMNDYAVLYGLSDTQFENPSGLHNDKHLSSAYDTAQMLRIAMQDKDFRKIATTKYYKNDLKNPTVWKNKHKLLHYNKYAIAGKTGYTKVAGRTLATYFEKDGKRVIVVTLNESNDWQVHAGFAEAVFEKYDKRLLAKKGLYQVRDDLQVELKHPVYALISKEERNKVKSILRMPRIEKGNTGIWTFYLDGQPLIEEPVQMVWK
ncbi:D-alanyl-D-alanine carboxypeptidase family protein [Rummeliibacillus suwonensis]|uniref:D-alanyl-D-alanine carboxypeptidase family protein n=1 Tax=Rummeliibacillus suwonensis TaxID=1306154 RepID=UPI0028993165|nr:serine hydrolase [Rummeliibacillus suwonensis]